MSGQTFHVCLSVRTAIQWSDRRLRGMVADEYGTRFTPREVREWLIDQLAQGHEVLPFGKPCEGFDYKTGCPGHAKPHSPPPRVDDLT